MSEGAGKGDSVRPCLVDKETYDKNWEKAFGKKRKKKCTKKLLTIGKNLH